VLGDWLDSETRRAPAALRARVRSHALTAGTTESIPAALAEAGRNALELIAEHPGDRSVALDLLAADALITLALLAQAQDAPERLADFAAALLPTGRQPA
jgi:hypothetical protein